MSNSNFVLLLRSMDFQFLKTTEPKSKPAEPVRSSLRVPSLSGESMGEVPASQCAPTVRGGTQASTLGLISSHRPDPCGSQQVMGPVPNS